MSDAGIIRPMTWIAFTDRKVSSVNQQPWVRD
jgi:hypothetical protein